MRTSTRWTLAAATVILALGAFAAPNGTRYDGSRPIRLSETTEILGTSVPPGSYALRWTREAGSETVRLEVTRGRTVLATGKGVWDSSEQAYPHEALVYRSGSGANALSEIRFRNSPEWIRVESGASGAVASREGGTPADVRK